MSQKAKLRVCASCEWIFRDNGQDCPKCGFGHYGARYVYGDRAYRHAVTQEPWKNKKLTEYELKLSDEIFTSNPIRKRRKPLAIRFDNE